MSTPDAVTTQTRGAASWLVVAFGVLVATHTIVTGVSRGATTGADISFVVMLLMVVALCGIGLQRSAPWAWWTAAVLVVVGLFFTLPVTGTILLGGAIEPVGTGWDVVFFPLTTLVLVALAGSLHMLRRKARGSGGSPGAGG